MFRHTAPRNSFRSFCRFSSWAVLGILLFCSNPTLAQETNFNLMLFPPSDRSSDRLSNLIANPVRRDLARRLGVPRQQLSITSSNPETWIDGCLGLNSPGELCVQVATEGWRVEVSNGQRSWFYRTDTNGRNIRLESEVGTVSLPLAVGDRILKVSAEQLGIPAEQLAINQSQQHWETCLTLSVECSDVPGWRAIVVDSTVDSGCWIYRANHDGSKVKLDEAIDSTVIPSFLPARQPVELGDAIVFRVIASGGFSRQIYETTLRQDGKLWRSLLKPGATISQSQFRQISPQQVEAFQQLLQQQQFNNFDGLNYSASDADSITVTLMGQNGVTQYNSAIEEQLPAGLVEIVRSWDELVS
jgi:hypothetical protein